MKTSIQVLIVLFWLPTLLFSQQVSNYSYQLNNGINVKEEKGWKHVYPAIRFDSTNSSALVFNITGNGNLIAESSYEILKDGKIVPSNISDAGIYHVAVTCKLLKNAGVISFTIEGVEIKDKMTTRLQVFIYDVLITIDVKDGAYKNLAHYETQTERYTGVKEQNLNWTLPYFYNNGDHAKKILPDEPQGDYYGNIKAGTYDLLLKTEIGGTNFAYKLWMENLSLEANKAYKITVNFNCGIIVYKGGNYAVKAIHLYPAGTADKNPGTPKPLKNEFIKYETPDAAKLCKPGKYDILLNFNFGEKYEWRKDIEIKTGEKFEIR